MTQGIPMKVVQPTEGLVNFRNASLALLKEHTGNLDSSEMLAVAAQMIGQMIAMMDQRKWTSDAIMALLIANIEAGNRSVLDAISDTKGSA